MDFPQPNIGISRHRGKKKEEKKKGPTAHLGIDAPLDGVDEIGPEALHLSQAYPRYGVLADDHGRDELLGVLLGGHAEEAARRGVGEADEIRVVLAHEDREDRRRARAKRVPDQHQPELVRPTRWILRRDFFFFFFFFVAVWSVMSSNDCEESEGILVRGYW